MSEVKLERLEAFEKRANVELRGLYVEHEVYDTTQYVTVNGELHSSDGDTLQNDVTVEIAVYDGEGRVLDSATSIVDAENFFAFEVFEIIAQCQPNVTPTKVRVYPKARLT